MRLVAVVLARLMVVVLIISVHRVRDFLFNHMMTVEEVEVLNLFGWRIRDEYRLSLPQVCDNGHSVVAT